jgi:HlyD family secretion protein
MTKKTLIIGVLVLALAGGGYWWYTRQAAATAAAGAEVTEIAEVFRGSLIESVQSTGRVVSNQDVDIKCKASGQVINLPADISDHVKKGDLLMELDPVDQQRTVQQSQAAVVSATARVAQARANLVAAEMDFEATRVRNESEHRLGAGARGRRAGEGKAGT